MANAVKTHTAKTRNADATGTKKKAARKPRTPQQIEAAKQRAEANAKRRAQVKKLEIQRFSLMEEFTRRVIAGENPSDLSEMTDEIKQLAQNVAALQTKNPRGGWTKNDSNGYFEKQIVGVRCDINVTDNESFPQIRANLSRVSGALAISCSDMKTTQKIAARFARLVSKVEEMLIV